MALKEYKTRTGTELVAEGVLTGIFLNPLKEIKNRGKPGSEWFPTHIINVVIDGLRVSLGMTDKEVVKAKDVNSEYRELVKGQEVSVVVQENGEYNGVKQYQGRLSDVIIMRQAPQESKQNTPTAFQRAYTPAKKDNTGVIAGNGFNAAKALLGGYSDEIPKVAKELIDIGYRIRQSVQEENPDLNEYEVGARSGMALIAACEWAEEIGQVEGYAQYVLKELLPPILEHAKGSDGEKEAVKTPAPKKTAAKKGPKTATKKEEVKETSPGFEAGDGPPELDDNIPF